MFKLFILKRYAQLTSLLKTKRRAVQLIKRCLLFLRRLKIPLYKNLYDTLSFLSYYMVLKKVLELKQGGSYFEWGPGLNTELALTSMKCVYSVEHDPQWAEMYKKRFNFLVHSSISSSSCLNYPGEIKKIGGHIDVAFVDGRCRTECLKACSEKGVPVVVMHDSLLPHDYSFATDGAPPEGHDKIYFHQGYGYYDYFLELPDLRTIILLSEMSDLKLFEDAFARFYTRCGKTSEYLTKELT